MMLFNPQKKAMSDYYPYWKEVFINMVKAAYSNATPINKAMADAINCYFEKYNQVINQSGVLDAKQFEKVKKELHLKIIESTLFEDIISQTKGAASTVQLTQAYEIAFNQVEFNFKHGTYTPPTLPTL